MHFSENWYPNGIDIDGKDDNGNDVGYEPNEVTSVVIYDDVPVKAKPYTQDQIFNNALSGYNYDLTNREQELVRFKDYLKKAEAEVAKWERHIQKNQDEIASLNKGISDLKKKYGK